MKTLTFEKTVASWDKIYDFLNENLSAKRINSRAKNELLLIAEEMFVKIVADSSKKNEAIATLSYGLDGYILRFYFSGKEFEIQSEEDDEIGASIVATYGKKISVSYKNGTNTVTIGAGNSYEKYFKRSAIAVLSAVLVYLFVNFILPQNLFSVYEAINTFSQNIFYSLLKMLAAPVVFFSLSSCISNYYLTLKRYPNMRRMVIRYAFTSAVAALIGIGLYFVSKNGIFPFQNFLIGKIGENTLSTDTVIKTLTSIIPENIFSSIVSENAVTIVFISVFSGLVIGAMSENGTKMKEITDTMNSFFSKILSIVYEVFPIILFFCIVDVLTKYGLKTILIFLGMFLLIAFGLVLLLGIYAYGLVSNGIKINDFFKKIKKYIPEFFKIGSVTDAIPLISKVCENNLKIPEKVITLTLPLSSVLNMDGNTMVLTFECLLVPLFFGANVGVLQIILIAVTSFLLSIGAPAQPGSVVMGCLILFPQLGLPPSVLAFAIIAEVLTTRINSFLSIIADITVTLIYAKQEGAIA